MALNLCIEADEKGIWEDFGVEIIGVDIDAINITRLHQFLAEVNGDYPPHLHFQIINDLQGNFGDFYKNYIDSLC